MLLLDCSESATQAIFYLSFLSLPLILFSPPTHPSFPTFPRLAPLGAARQR